jgi:hypothetical protein
MTELLTKPPRSKRCLKNEKGIYENLDKQLDSKSGKNLLGEIIKAKY